MDICNDCVLMQRYSRIDGAACNVRNYYCIIHTSPHAAMCECSAYVKKHKSDTCEEETKYDLPSVMVNLTDCINDLELTTLSFSKRG